MDRERQRFRDELIAAESVAPDLREQYERAVHEMLHRRLTSAQKVGHVIGAVIAAALATLFGVMAATADELPLLARLTFGLGTVFGLGWAVMMARILRRGDVDLRADANTMTGMAWGFVVLLMTIMLLMAGSMADQVKAVNMLVGGLVFLVMGAAFLITNRVDQSELNTREKLLEIEYRLTELAERLPGSDARE